MGDGPAPSQGRPDHEREDRHPRLPAKPTRNRIQELAEKAGHPDRALLPTGMTKPKSVRTSIEALADREETAKLILRDRDQPDATGERGKTTTTVGFW